jgi:hypothetical protein
MAGERTAAPREPPVEETIEEDEERADTLRQIAEVEEGLPHRRPAMIEQRAVQHRALARVYTEEAAYLRNRPPPAEGPEG